LQRRALQNEKGVQLHPSIATGLAVVEQRHGLSLASARLA
jgi:hypothetical protein